jgi:hypothetical protein
MGSMHDHLSLTPNQRGRRRIYTSAPAVDLPYRQGDLECRGRVGEVSYAFLWCPARSICRRRRESTFVVADLLEFPPYHAGDKLVRAIVDLAGARSVVIAPLRKEAVTLGAITIYRQEVRPFSVMC